MSPGTHRSVRSKRSSKIPSGRVESSLPHIDLICISRKAKIGEGTGNSSQKLLAAVFQSMRETSDVDFRRYFHIGPGPGKGCPGCSLNETHNTTYGSSFVGIRRPPKARSRYSANKTKMFRNIPPRYSEISLHRYGVVP